MYNEPRNWKWMVPAALIAPMVVWWSSWFLTADYNRQWMRAWSVVPLTLAIICGLSALVNLWKYVSAHWMNLDAQRMEALNSTPVTKLAEALKQMHPEAVRVLNRFGVKTSWQVRVDAIKGTRDWILAGTNVHFAFVEFVLFRSTNTTLLAKNKFSEGSKRWDPDGMMEDREQYDEFEAWLIAHMMTTRSLGEFKPAQFLPPWTPATILEVMGLSGEPVDLERPEEKAIRDLTPAHLTPSPSPKPLQGASQGEGSNGKTKPMARIMDAPPVTDEEMLAIQEEERRYAEQYQS